MLRKLFVILLFVVLHSNAGADQQHQPIRIGVVYGMSGPAQVWSRYGRMGLEMAAKEINEQGGIGGRPISLLYQDSQSTPKGSVSAYRKLVSQDKVEAIIGDVWSILTNPLIPLSERDRIPVLSPTVMDAAVESRSKYFFTMGHRLESVRGPVRAFFKNNPEITSVAFLCWEDAWGRANLKIWQEVAEEKNIRVTDTICQGDYANDFRADVTRAARGKPDALMVAMYAERVLQRVREQRLPVKVLSTNCVLEAFAEKGEMRALLEGLYISYWDPGRAFNERFMNEYGELPILEAHNHYEALRALARGYDKNPEDLRNGLAQLSYQGVAGKIDFTQGPYVNFADGALLQVKAGALVPIGSLNHRE